jgi:hypothetical protein
MPGRSLPYWSFGAELSARAEAVDLTDLDLGVRDAPYSEFARLRRDTPVA